MTNKNYKTKSEFLTMLRNHDWYYQMADDPSVHNRGKIKAFNIKLAIEERPELEQVYDDYRAGKYRD